MSDRCEKLRDRLPELAAGRLDEAEAAALRSHVAACDACAAEFALVRTLAADLVTVPFGLDARVRSVLQQSRRYAWVTPGRMAMAATVVLALVTASLIDRPDRESSVEPDTTFASTLDAVLTAPWGASEEALLTAPSLDQLSVEELEMLLRELGS